jgi:transposase
MNDVLSMLEHWHLNVSAVLEHVYRAPTPRERERWHALWLLARGSSAGQVAEALGRDAHTIGNWLEDFRQSGPTAMAFEQAGGSPPPSTSRNKRS